MSSNKQNFTHISLQDKRSIKKILQAVTEALDKGEMTFKDDTDHILLSPEGLMRLKISAETLDNHQQFSLKVSWDRAAKQKPPKINQHNNRHKSSAK